MSDSSQLVTILLATYNRAHLIRETLDSILAQTYTNWECIIIDDYSIDNTKEVIDAYIEKDDRFSYFIKTEKYNKGLSGSRNQSIDIAKRRKAQYIQFFDDDDIMHPLKLEMQIKPLLKDSSVHMTLCKYRKFHIKDTIEMDLEKAEDNSLNIESDNLLWDFYYNRIVINSLGPIWRFDIIKKYYFDTSLVTGEERDLYMKIFSSEKIKYVSVNKILFWYRKHKDSVTSLAFTSSSNYNMSLRKVQKNSIVNMLKSKNIGLFRKCKLVINYLKLL